MATNMSLRLLILFGSPKKLTMLYKADSPSLVSMQVKISLAKNDRILELAKSKKIMITPVIIADSIDDSTSNNDCFWSISIIKVVVRTGINPALL
jgi:hypothetical protein